MKIIRRTKRFDGFYDFALTLLSGFTTVFDGLVIIFTLGQFFGKSTFSVLVHRERKRADKYKRSKECYG